MIHLHYVHLSIQIYQVNKYNYVIGINKHHHAKIENQTLL